MFASCKTLSLGVSRLLTVMDSVVQARPDWPGFLPQLENRPELLVADRIDPDISRLRLGPPRASWLCPQVRVGQVLRLSSGSRESGKAPGWRWGWGDRPCPPAHRCQGCAACPLQPGLLPRLPAPPAQCLWGPSGFLHPPAPSLSCTPSPLTWQDHSSSVAFPWSLSKGSGPNL